MAKWKTQGLTGKEMKELSKALTFSPRSLYPEQELGYR